MVDGQSREMGKDALILRYGLALEGGNSQSSIVTLPTNPTGVTTNSNLMTIKGYVGASLRSSGPVPSSDKMVGPPFLHHQSFSAAYGIELGSTNQSNRVDFVKHVVDFAFDLTLLPFNHHPVSIETDLAAGLIQSRGIVPLTERFFGGNAPQYFTDSNSMQLQSAPFIRSIPFGEVGTIRGVPIGADRFLSFSSTFAFTVYGVPMVPNTLVRSQDFKGALRKSLDDGQNFAYDSYLSDMPSYRKALVYLGPLAAAIDKASTDLDRIQSSGNRSPELLRAQNGVLATRRSLDAINKDIGHLQGYTDSGDSTAPFSRLVTALTKLKVVITSASDVTSINSDIDAIGSLQRQISVELNNVTDADVDLAQKKAERDLAFAKPIRKTILDEMNVVGISPVVTLDYTKIGPKRIFASDSYLAIGSGLRFNLVNFNVTAGYARNLNSTLQQRRGAFFLSLNMKELF